MKKMFLLLLVVLPLMAQDVSVQVGASTFYRDTLTTSIDTVDVNFSNNYSYHTLLAFTLSGADTVQIYALSLDGTTWSRHSAVDATDGTNVTQIVASTTPKEYVLFDTKPQTVRLISTSNDGSSTVFVLGTKR